MMMPGAVFSVTNSPSSFIRTSFAFATDEEIVEGFRYGAHETRSRRKDAGLLVQATDVV